MNNIKAEQSDLFLLARTLELEASYMREGQRKPYVITPIPAAVQCGVEPRSKPLGIKVEQCCPPRKMFSAIFWSSFSLYSTFNQRLTRWMILISELKSERSTCPARLSATFILMPSDASYLFLCGKITEHYNQSTAKHLWPSENGEESKTEVYGPQKRLRESWSFATRKTTE